MFTGIVLAKGRLTSVTERGGDLELGIDAAGLDAARLGLGDSICVQGACLTVTRKQGAVMLYNPTTAATTTAATIATANVREDGLHSLVLDPNFAANGRVFALYSARSPGEQTRLRHQWTPYDR